MTLNPPIMWAQDHDNVYVTIKLQDIQNEKIEFHNGSFRFIGHTPADNHDYDYNFELFEEIVPDSNETRYSKFGRYTQLNLRKRNTLKWWPRLAKTDKKLHNVAIDWEKWVDDDGDEEAASHPDEMDINNTPDDEMTSSDSEEENKNEK